MGGIVALFIGLTVSAFGFLIMRNPMRLALLSPWQKGYYQRMILDTTMRNQLRLLGALMCLFGTGIAATVLGSVLKIRALDAASQGLWVLMGLIFFAAWGVGLILAIRQLIRGELFDWWRMWVESAKLGPIDVFPPATPKMQKETKLFTVALLSLAALAMAAGIAERLM